VQDDVRGDGVGDGHRGIGECIDAAAGAQGALLARARIG
jgi:hypothetical protein